MSVESGQNKQTMEILLVDLGTILEMWVTQKLFAPFWDIRRCTAV